MISRIFTLMVCSFFMGNLYAQSSSSYEMVDKYKKFLSGTFDTQEGCSNPNASKGTITYYPLQNQLIGGELRAVRDNISKVINTFTIENIEVFDANKGLYKLEVTGKNEITGNEFESLRIMQFDGSSTRLISRVDDGKEIVSDGIIISSGLDTKPFFNCSNISKKEVLKNNDSLAQSKENNFRLSNYISVSNELRRWLILIALGAHVLLILFFAFKFKQSIGKSNLNDILTDVGGGSFLTQVIAFSMTIIYFALCVILVPLTFVLPEILKDLI
jgi:hypothetical protein